TFGIDSVDRPHSRRFTGATYRVRQLLGTALSGDHVGRELEDLGRVAVVGTQREPTMGELLAERFVACPFRLLGRGPGTLLRISDNCPKIGRASCRANRA